MPPAARPRADAASPLCRPPLGRALTDGSASLLSRATTRARPGQAARCCQRAASSARSGAVVGACDRACAGRGEPGRGDGRASCGFAAASPSAAGRSEVQLGPARAARARPDSRGAGAAVRRDPVRAGATAHPGDTAERGRDGSADLAGPGGRARWLANGRRGRPGAGQRSAVRPFALPSARVQRIWRGPESLELTSD